MLDLLFVKFHRLLPDLLAARLMPDASLQPEVITVVEDDTLGAGPCGRIAATNPTEIFVIIGQAVAAGVIPVVPERAEITHADGIGITGDRLQKILAVERQTSGRFFHFSSGLSPPSPARRAGGRGPG